MNYTCPVCFYPNLEEPPFDFEICPACGTEFGYQDAAPTPTAQRARHTLLRARWLQEGAKWFDPTTPQPPDWSAHIEELKRTSTEVEDDMPLRIEEVEGEPTVTLP